MPRSLPICIPEYVHRVTNGPNKIGHHLFTLAHVGMTPGPDSESRRTAESGEMVGRKRMQAYYIARGESTVLLLVALVPVATSAVVETGTWQQRWAET